MKVVRWIYVSDKWIIVFELFVIFGIIGISKEMIIWSGEF